MSTPRKCFSEIFNLSTPGKCFHEISNLSHRGNTFVKYSISPQPGTFTRVFWHILNKKKKQTCIFQFLPILIICVDIKFHKIILHKICGRRWTIFFGNRVFFSCWLPVFVSPSCFSVSKKNSNYGQKSESWHREPHLPYFPLTQENQKTPKKSLFGLICVYLNLEFFGLN